MVCSIQTKTQNKNILNKCVTCLSFKTYITSPAYSRINPFKMRSFESPHPEAECLIQLNLRNNILLLEPYCVRLWSKSRLNGTLWLYEPTEGLWEGRARGARGERDKVHRLNWVCRIPVEYSKRKRLLFHLRIVTQIRMK